MSGSKIIRAKWLVLVLVAPALTILFQNCGPSFESMLAQSSNGVATTAPTPLTAIRSAYGTIPAISADEKVGTQEETGNDGSKWLGYIENGHSLTFKSLDFENGAKSITLNVALVKESTYDSNSRIEIRAGSSSGSTIGTFVPQATSGWTSFENQSVNLSSPISGVSDITFVFIGNQGIVNLKSFVFSKSTIVVPEPPPAAPEPPPVQPPTPPPAGTYGTPEKPFAANSPWNAPIPSNARYLPNDPRSTSLRGRSEPFQVHSANWTINVWYANANDPTVKVNIWNESRQIFESSVSIRIPSNAYPAFGCYGGGCTDPQPPVWGVKWENSPGRDAHMTVIDPDRQHAHEFYHAARESNGSITAWAYVKTPLNSDGLNISAGLNGECTNRFVMLGWCGVRAYGGSQLGGLIRTGELDSEINHALAVLIPPQLLKNSSWVWPATRDDLCNGCYSGVIPMGTRFAIPRDVNVHNLGLNSAELRIALALQKYGMYIVDKNGGGINLNADGSDPQMNQSNNVNGRVTASGMQKLKNLLTVVEWQ